MSGSVEQGCESGGRAGTGVGAVAGAGAASSAGVAAVDPDRVARAGLSRCVEPEDHLGAVFAAVLDMRRWWELIRGADPGPDEVEALVTAASLAGVPRAGTALVAKGLERWRPRAREADPVADLHHASAVGGGFLTPGDPAWPVGLDSLGPAAPFGLWWRGAGDLPRDWGTRPLLSVVGTRDPTAYGLAATQQIVSALAAEGAGIVSGGALGIDAAAHRSALAAGSARPATVAVLAGGIDRLYPSSNAQLLAQIAREQLLVTEHPPGCAPTRWRFLSRNRLIAALAPGTLVTEARWRSGSLSTAHRAAELGRWVGAVPGPIAVATSDGCHRLVREGAAELITRAEDVIEALGWQQDAVLPGADAWGEGGGGDGAAGDASARQSDGLDDAELRVWEALPVSRGVSLDRLLSVAGLGPSEALAALQRLSHRGRVAQGAGGEWSRVRPRS